MKNIESKSYFDLKKFAQNMANNPIQQNDNNNNMLFQIAKEIFEICNKSRTSGHGESADVFRNGYGWNPGGKELYDAFKRLSAKSSRQELSYFIRGAINLAKNHTKSDGHGMGSSSIIPSSLIEQANSLM